MNILVTGAGGYVGIPLCQALVTQGHRVIGLDRYYFGVEKLGALARHPRFTVLTDDVRDFDPGALDGVEAVIDLAGLSNDPCAAIDADLTRQINVDGCLRVVRAARKQGVRRYIFVSSAAVYGSSGGVPMAEDAACAPLTEYARSKLQVEQALLELQAPDFEIVVMRSATIFGLAPRMRFDLAVNVMTMHAWRDGEIFVHGGQQWRPFIHVQDGVQALLLALDAPASIVAGETFNLGDDGMNFSIGQLADMVAAALPGTIQHQVANDSDDRSYRLDCRKIKRVLGFAAGRDVPAGIEEIIGALETGSVSADDLTTVTLGWYQSLMEWGQVIDRIQLNGRII
ncbi:MAG: NAD(P)-dependent oxidoreductase [Alphaproteobacteria bacterium]